MSDNTETFIVAAYGRDGEFCRECGKTNVDINNDDICKECFEKEKMEEKNDGKRYTY